MALFTTQTSSSRRIQILQEQLYQLSSTIQCFQKDISLIDGLSKKGFNNTMMTIFRCCDIEFTAENVDKYYNVFEPWKSTNHCIKYQQYCWERPSHYYDDYAASCLCTILKQIR